MLDKLPIDSDGNALRQLAVDGSDLSRPMAIDFAVAVPDRIAGEAVAEKVTGLGLRPDVYYDSDSNSWTCYCTKVMIPEYNEIIAVQRQLDKVSRPFGGKADGWGSFGNAGSKPAT